MSNVNANDLQAFANALALATGAVSVTVTDSGLTATSLTGERADAYHDHLATLWAAYNSRSGRASNAQVERIKRQLSIEDLVRMLTARRVVVPPPAAA
jgi:hypothetical protein